VLTIEMMQRRWPHGNQHIPGLIEGIVKAENSDILQRYKVVGVGDHGLELVLAHFMAQASEECGQGLEMIESLNYTKKRLLQVFPTHFTPSMAARWEHNEKMIGEIAYGGRLGNAPPPSTDGFDFRGAGLTQVTGRDGHTELQKILDAHKAGFNVIDNPQLIISPEHAFECGIADWLVCGCLKYAQDDDIVNETKHLNGGLNGLDERKRQLVLWKHELLPH
jgi:putative chitinase